MASKIIKCKDCGGDFVFSEQEQAFFREMKFNDPKRCPPCRKAKRAKKVSNG